ncbi:OadG family protein [Endozoicomonas arenosclerae]|uniref:OadG family protein n=1 Tax=Endozoicomonas arenosclerae TaxID=1633495 RepID=UPI00078409FC|nr:OadG family protein [Endozoicomonas arenosclerae]
MSPSDLLSEGLSLMAFGMGFVFLFLTALVIITSLMSRVIGRFFPDPVPASPVSARQSARPDANQYDTELVAAISAAIRMHRAREPGSKNT